MSSYKVSAIPPSFMSSVHLRSVQFSKSIMKIWDSARPRTENFDYFFKFVTKMLVTTLRTWLSNQFYEPNLQQFHLDCMACLCEMLECLLKSRSITCSRHVTCHRRQLDVLGRTVLDKPMLAVTWYVGTFIFI